MGTVFRDMLLHSLSPHTTLVIFSSPVTCDLAEESDPRPLHSLLSSSCRERGIHPPCVRQRQRKTTLRASLSWGLAALWSHQSGGPIKQGSSIEYLWISVERPLHQHSLPNSSTRANSPGLQHHVKRAAHSAEAAEIPLLHLYSVALQEICALCDEACSLSTDFLFSAESVSAPS